MKSSKEAKENIGNLTLEDITVSGSISAKQHIGGLVGKAYNEGSVTVTNCINNANITANDSETGSCAGIIGYMYYQKSATIDHCINNGNITAAKAFAGIVHSAVVVTVKNCTNTGILTWKYSKYV